MKKTISATLLLLLLSNWIVAQEGNCVRMAMFGETEICLPHIEGYWECYSDSIVKQLADGNEVPNNMVLGFYLNNQVYEKKDSIGLISFDDYFKVYGTKQIKDFKADSKFLHEMQEMFTGNFLSKNWELIEKDIDKIGRNVEVGVPIMIKAYNVNENSFSAVMLITYEFEGVEPYTLAMTINGLLINERLVWMAYYLYYNGEETIAILQEKSNAILTQLVGTDK